MVEDEEHQGDKRGKNEEFEVIGSFQLYLRKEDGKIPKGSSEGYLTTFFHFLF